MSIVVTCPFCSNPSAVDPGHAGHQVQCPHCTGVMEVPMPAAAAPPYGTGDYHALAGSQAYAPGYGAAPAAPSTFICAGCGGMFVSAEAVDVNGVTCCQSCAPAVAPAPGPPAPAAPAPAPAAPSRRAAPAAADEPVAPAGAAAASPIIEVMDRCDGCGEPFSPVELYSVKGKNLCAACAAAAATGHAVAPVAGVGQAYDAHADATHHDDAAAAAAVAHDDSAAASSYARRPPKQADYTGLIVGGAIAVVLLVGGFIYMTRAPAPELAKRPTSTTRPTGTGTSGTEPTPAAAVDPKVAAWEKTNGREIRSLERLATSQVDRKDFAGADQTYAQIMDLVKASPGGAGPQDAGLKALVDGARRKWDGIKASVPRPVAVSADVKAEVERLLNEAEFAYKGGSKTAAFERYKELFAIAKGNTLKGLDPALQKRVAAASETRRAILDELRSRKDAFDITATRLLDTGYAALNKGNWEAAFDTLWDVRLLSDRRVKLNDRMRDEDFVRGAHGIAVAYIGLGRAGEAADMFDETQTLGILAKEKPTKELLWNRGIFDIESKTRASRTVKALVEFMSKDEAKVDEDLLNLLGTAIATAFANPGEDLAELYKAADYFKKRNAQLEATRSGQMH
jgi:hypothetical protein